MATLPTVPSVFTDGTAPSITTLNQLSYCVSFLCDMDIRPAWHLYKTATQAITSGVQTNVNYGSVAYTSDNNAATFPFATINTQGYYAVEAAVPILTGVTAIEFLLSFLITGGPSNPHLAPAATKRFAQRGGESCSTASTDTALCLADIVPIVCYPGDTIAVQILTDTNVTLNINANASFISGRTVPDFTGYWISTGT